MMPIQHVLNRIRWDSTYGVGFFEIGYMDHSSRRIIRVALKNVRFEEDNRFSFQLVDNMGEVLMIPFHRIRQVYRDGGIIWERPACDMQHG